jgi:hypothetical protein
MDNGILAMERAESQLETLGPDITARPAKYLSCIVILNPEPDRTGR